MTNNQKTQIISAPYKPTEEQIKNAQEWLDSPPGSAIWDTYWQRSGSQQHWIVKILAVYRAEAERRISRDLQQELFHAEQSAESANARIIELNNEILKLVQQLTTARAHIKETE